MREILFRGKNVLTGEWHYGSLQAFKGFSIFDHNLKSWHVVRGETVGQYTGLKDKNGKYIFEGDIVHYLYEPGKGYWNADQLSVIDFRGTGFHMNGIMGTNKYACMHGWLVSIPYDQDAENKPEFEVVGNIHDNPELLKEADHA